MADTAAGDAHDRLDHVTLDPHRKGPQVQRFGHGSRVPGWDDAVDLEKDPADIPDLAITPVPADLHAEIEAAMAKYPDRRSAAIPALAAAQRVHGWCSPEAIDQVAAVMRLTPGYLIAVASFYDMLETGPVGSTAVYVCTNISCSLRGADELYERLVEEVGDDPDVNLRSFECLGACDIAPMVSVNGVYAGPVEDADVADLVRQLKTGEEVLPAKQLLKRRSVDPGAGGGAPDPGQPTTYGGTMPGDQRGPSAPIEQPPSGPQHEEGKSQKD
jgi:NADH-quinone oxidoreductase subunit E